MIGLTSLIPGTLMKLNRRAGRGDKHKQICNPGINID